MSDSKKASFTLSDRDKVTVTQTKHITEIQYLEKMNTKQTIRKIDKDHYADLDTGEIKEFQHSENRADLAHSLRATFKKLRYLINNNFDGSKNELFITLTYAENMRDEKKLYSDFKKFMKKLRYRFRNESDIDYLSVVEPQGRGAWHMHVLVRFNALNSVFVANKTIRDLWGHGEIVSVKRIDSVDNIGAYLSAYLTDIEATEENVVKVFEKSNKDKLEVVEKDTDKGKKKFIKGGRLYLYPPGMNYYRSSKGIKHPERKKMTYKKAKKIVGSTKPQFTSLKSVETDDFENTIYYEEYNSKKRR